MMILNLVKERLSFLKKAYYTWKQKQLGTWNFFLWMEKKGERQIRHKYYKQKEKTATNTDSIVIYMANGYTWHGGLADRLKGIVSLYAWCKDHGKSFRINFVHPFRLQNYLMPNHYDWLVADEDISYNPKESKVLQCLMNVGSLEFLNLIKFAKYCIGRSFHLCVFSLLFKKEFQVVGGLVDQRNLELAVSLFDDIELLKYRSNKDLIVYKTDYTKRFQDKLLLLRDKSLHLLKTYLAD